MFDYEKAKEQAKRNNWEWPRAVYTSSKIELDVLAVCQDVAWVKPQGSLVKSNMSSAQFDTLSNLPDPVPDDGPDVLCLIMNNDAPDSEWAEPNGRDARGEGSMLCLLEASSVQL